MNVYGKAFMGGTSQLLMATVAQKTKFPPRSTGVMSAGNDRQTGFTTDSSEGLF
jgi:hypothetical protein